MAAQKIQAEFAPNRPRGRVRQGAVDEIGEHRFDDRVAHGALDDPLEFAHPGCAGAVPELGGGGVFASCRVRRR
jgi:hypothetical protein